MKKVEAKEAPKAKRKYVRKTKAVEEKKEPQVFDIPLEEINRLCQREPYRAFEYKARYVWDRPNDPFHKSYLSLYASPTGCGLKLLQGNTSLIYAIEGEIKRLKKALKEEPHAAYLATIGDSHKKANTLHEQNLFDLGFKFLAQYNNPGHGENYQQYLYILI